MKKSLFSLFVCALVSVSSWAGADGENVRAVKLTGQEVKVDPDNGFKIPIIIFGDKLISQDYYGKHGVFAHKLNNAEWKKAEGELTIGKNDGMDENDYIFGIYGFDNSLVCLTRAASFKKLTIIPNTKSIAGINDQSSWKEYDWSVISNIVTVGNKYALMSDSMILIAAAPKDNSKQVLAIADFKNNKVIPLDYWPDDGINDVPAKAKSVQYVANSDVFGNGNGRYLYTSCWRRFSFIFTVDNDKVNVVKNLYTDYPKYKKNDGAGYYTIPTELCNEHMECTANSQSIYTLLIDSYKDGAKYEKFSTNFFDYKFGRVYGFGNVVEIHDWNGNKQNVLYLDHYGNKMILSDDGKKLYLYCNDFIQNGHKMWVYDISNLDNLPQVDVEEIEKARALNVTKPSSNSLFPNKKDVTTSAKVVNEGDMMADFELYDYDDNPHHLNEFLGKGRYTILEFSSIGCGPCQQARPTLEKFYKQYKDKFEMITISEDYEKTWKKKPVGEVSWHEWNDHKQAHDICNAYGVLAIPTFVIIDSNGKVLKKCIAFNALLDALKEFIPAEEVEKLIQ